MSKTGRPPKYKTDEERKAARRAYKREWKAAHKESVAASNRKYWKAHKTAPAAPEK